METKRGDARGIQRKGYQRGLLEGIRGHKQHVGEDGNQHSKGGLCNTPGVCHQLSNGFELEHGILSDDEDVKVQPIETSPNLNLDIAPLLAYRPLFQDICLGGVIGISS